VTGAGTHEVLIVRYGTRTTSRNDVFLNYPVYGEPDAPIDMDYFCWVIRGGGRTILVDTGFSQAGGAARGRTMLIDPRDALAALGVRPDDEPLVVVTHAHYDHIGNLAHFARSPVVIAKAEIDFWTGPYGRRVQFHHSVEDSELGGLQAAMADGRVTTFGDRLALGDGIEVLRVGGHTPGQAVVIVPTAAGPVLLASDAVHYYEELERDMPFVSATSLVDMYAGFDLIRGLLKDQKIDLLVTGHDPATLARFPGHSGEPKGAVAVVGASADRAVT
jgi:glyoxylase-like metal-dependent hydrolase (beta-lactamase superfamily II)